MTGEQEFYWTSLSYLFTFPALGGLLFGYDIGATSFVLEQITTGDYSGVKWDNYLDDHTQLQGAITSSSVFGALLSSILVFQVADHMGRKYELVVGALLYMIGAFIAALSARPSWNAETGISVLIFGRVVYGCGIGFAMHGAPAYIGEMSPPSIRGVLISLKEAAIVLGILLGYLIGFLFSTTKGGWAYTFGLAMIFAAIMFFGSYFLLVESTRFLYLKGKLAQAKESMDWILLPEASDRAFNEMADQNVSIRKASIADSDGATDSKLLSFAPKLTNSQTTSQPPPVYSKRFRPALIAGVGLVFLQQVTGQPSVLYYAATIFKDAGLASVATVGVAAFKLVMTMIAVFTVDYYGRRSLLFIGISCMLVALIALAIAFNFTTTSDDDDETKNIGPTQIIILFSMFVYIGGYQIGFGPIAWLLISEVFPLEVRGQAVAVAVQTNFFWNVVTSYLFPIATSAIGASKTFGIFAVIDAFAIYFVFKFVPETKGLSLEDIEILLGSRVSPALRSISKAGDEYGHSASSPLLRNGESYHGSYEA